jgi:hypothetical protein
VIGKTRIKQPLCQGIVLEMIGEILQMGCTHAFFAETAPAKIKKPPPGEGGGWFRGGLRRPLWAM